MPRHDRAYGRWHAPGNKAGRDRRKEASHAMRSPQAGRKDGASKPDNSPTPQKPKGSPSPKPKPSK